MQTIAAQTLNSLLYASSLFLIAGGLSLIYGVMRIVNLAHGNMYALGAYVMAWVSSV
ncbi:MAG: ABC transporter permease subunit [bacterium]